MKAKPSILIIGKFDDESMASHISETLGTMGHKTIPLNYGVKYSHRNTKLAFTYNKFQLVMQSVLWNTAYHEKKVEKWIRTAIANNKIDLVIVTHDFLKPAEVQLIKDLTGAPVVLWFPDAVVNFGRHMFLNAPFDYMFFKDRFIVQRMQTDFPSKNIGYLPECCNPRIHHLYDIDAAAKAKFACDITTAGNLYANRVAFFEQLADMNLDIKIWGNPPSKWMDVSKISGMLKSEYITGKEKAFAFSEAKIVLNNLHPAEVDSINCRAFEIPAMGGFQVINWRECISELFEPGKEIITFQHADELKDKIRFYLSPAGESERAAIKMNALKRVTADHTYEKRMTEILRHLSFSN